MREIKRILVANRGEIACRIFRTVKTMGLESVAVYSDADAGALHVGMADQAFRLGPSPAVESYLAVDRVLSAARETGADAIHSGYGFLSENADFADACAAAGIAFIGPSSGAIRAMGSKSAAKALMQAQGAALIGYQPVNGINCFRLIFMNPDVSFDDADRLLDLIAEHSEAAWRLAQ